ncbi:MAG: hypothetical protein M3Z04_16200 [Chloroflexota bacterium]|nr:hypothetical protein [Chloroflexota bacterium]
MTMQEQLVITLQPERVTVTAGGDEAQVIAVIHNQTSVIDSYSLDIPELDPTWFTLPVRTVALFPNEQKTINIVLRAPGNLDTLAGRYDYTLRARSAAVANRISQANGVLFVALAEALTLRVKRDLIRGQEATFELTLLNRSKTPQDVVLSANDREGMLDYAFDPPNPQLAAGGSATIHLHVRLPAGQTLRDERTFPFTITAQSADDREKARPLPAQFIYVPGQIRMELLPARLKGIEGRFNLNVSNPGINTVALECALSGKDQEDLLDIHFQQNNLTLQPGTSVILPVTVRVRQGIKPELRLYTFFISVRQGGAGANAPEIGMAITGSFVYEPPVEYGITIERATSANAATNTQDDFKVKITNPSHAGLRLTLRAEDPAGALDLYFGTRVDQIQLAPEGSTEVPLLVRLKGAPPADEQTFPFQVIVHAAPDDGSSETDQVAQGEFVYGHMDTLFRLDMVPPEMVGDIGHFQLRLTSGVNNTLPVVLRARDDGNLLAFAFEPQKVDLKPGAVELVDLTVTPKEGGRIGNDGSDFGYRFEAIAWVPGMGTNGATSQYGTWFYTPPSGPQLAPVSVQLTPTQIVGDTGQFTVTLANTSLSPMVVLLRGSDEAEALQFLFQAERLELDAREVRELSLIVRGAEGEALAGPFRYPFEVTAWVPGMATNEAGVQYGEMVVTEAPHKKPLFLMWQRIAITVGLVLWMAAPFVLSRLGSNNPAINAFLPYITTLVFPLVAAALYGVNKPQEVRGWKAALVGWLGFGSIAITALQLLLYASPQTAQWAPFVNMLLLPALLIILLA